MNWKLIEQKPDNWEVLQRILQRVASEPSSSTSRVPDVAKLDESWKDPWLPHLYVRQWENRRLNTTKYRAVAPAESVWTPQWVNDGQHRLTKFKEELSRAFRERNGKKGSKTNPGVQALRKTELLQKSKALETVLPRALEQIGFQDQTAYPIKTNFSIDVLQWLVFAEWILFIMPRIRTWMASPRYRKVCLDAYISWLRVYEREIHPKQGEMHADMLHLFDGVHAYAARVWTATAKTNDPFLALFQHPVLMVRPFIQTHHASVDLYPEQRKVMEFIADAVLWDKPLLLGDRRPPGTGKTFSVAPLTLSVKALQRKKFILFTCQNDLVRLDVARNALLAEGIKLWMARSETPLHISSTTGAASIEREVDLLLRPHKSCFPTIWKKIYKREDAEKMGSILEQFQYYEQTIQNGPDIIVGDVASVIHILRHPVLRERAVLVFDEVVYDEMFQSTLIDVLRYLPRQTVLLSSILPQFSQVQDFIDDFCRHHGADPDHHIIEVETQEHACISCTVVDPEGYLALPHHFSSLDQLDTLIRTLRADVLVSRLYTPYHVYIMLQKAFFSTSQFQGNKQEFVAEYFQGDPELYTVFIKKFHWDWRFKDAIHHVDHRAIRSLVADLFQFLSDRSLGNLYSAFCSYRPQILPAPFQVDKMLSEQAHYFQGKTLYIDNNDVILERLRTAAAALMENAPRWDNIMRSRNQTREAMQREIDRLSTTKISRTQFDQQVAEVREMMGDAQTVAWPPAFRVNSREHFTRFHQAQSIQENPLVGAIEMPYHFPEEVLNAFDNDMLALLHSGVGLYETTKYLTDFQQTLFLRIMKSLTFLFSGRELIFGTNVEGLTNLVVEATFGETAPRAYLYQLMGRVGRLGYSYEAQVITTSEATFSKIMNVGTVEPFEESLLARWSAVRQEK